MRKLLSSIVAACACALALSLTSVMAADKATPGKKLTCCQEAHAKGKSCANNCCVSAHRKGQSCTRCNPNKEDLAIINKAESSSKKQPAAK